VYKTVDIDETLRQAGAARNRVKAGLDGEAHELELARAAFEQDRADLLDTLNVAADRVLERLKYNAVPRPVQLAPHRRLAKGRVVGWRLQWRGRTKHVLLPSGEVACPKLHPFGPGDIERRPLAELIADRIREPEGHTMLESWTELQRAFDPIESREIRLSSEMRMRAGWSQAHDETLEDLAATLADAGVML
jgi:hypothetical protein